MPAAAGDPVNAAKGVLYRDDDYLGSDRAED